MIVHLVLFEPRPDLTDVEGRFLEALQAAAQQIPQIRRFRIGRRTKHGLPGYEQAMRGDYQFVAILEFDDIDGLTSYLQHPAHTALGRHFSESGRNALAYDYEVVDAAQAAQLIRR